MAIQQVIKYNSKNRYFTGFLQALIDESEINASVSQSENEILLLLDESDAKALERFSALSAKYLPHSIFLGDIKTLQTVQKIQKSAAISPTYNISLCPKCLELLCDPASESYLDDTIKCTHYANAAEKDFYDTTNFSPHYREGDCVLIVDTKNIGSLFVMTEDEMRALFSIEKPTLKVTIKDETLKEVTGKKFINIKSAYNVRSTLVALNAKESGVPYMFFEDVHDFKVIVVQKNITIIKDTKELSQKLEPLSETPDLNRFLNIAKEAGFTKNSIGASLSLEHGISYMITNEVGSKKVITIEDFVLGEVLADMKRSTTKHKMLLNFEKKYPQIIEELRLHPEYSMFEALSVILELNNRSFEAVSDKALEFRGNGGLKIDTNFTETGFDYVSFIGSLMSFKLANTDDHYLAYSAFEALGDMSVTTLNQLKTRFKCENFVMMGSMFENSILYSRILSKFALSHPYFSKSFALDD